MYMYIYIYIYIYIMYIYYTYLSICTLLFNLKCTYCILNLYICFRGPIANKQLNLLNGYPLEIKFIIIIIIIIIHF